MWRVSGVLGGFEVSLDEDARISLGGEGTSSTDSEVVPYSGDLLHLDLPHHPTFWSLLPGDEWRAKLLAEAPKPASQHLTERNDSLILQRLSENGGSIVAALSCYRSHNGDLNFVTSIALPSRALAAVYELFTRLPAELNLTYRFDLDFMGLAGEPSADSSERTIPTLEEFLAGRVFVTTAELTFKRGLPIGNPAPDLLEVRF